MKEQENQEGILAGKCGKRRTTGEVISATCCKVQVTVRGTESKVLGEEPN